MLNIQKYYGSKTSKQKCALTVALLLALGLINCHAQQARIDSFLGALQKANQDTNKAYLLYKLGFFYSMVDPDKGINFALQGLRLAKQLNWEHGIAEANNNVGICYLCKSDLTKSFQYYSEALTIFEKQNDKRGELKVLGNIGNVFNSKSDFPQSLRYYFLALKYAEELNDKNSIAINLSNIGATYESMKELQKALEYDQKALKINEDKHDTLKMGNCQSNIGNVYSDLANYREALRCDLSALEFYNHLGNNEGIIRTMSNVGVAYSDLKNYDKALEYYFKSLAIARKTDFKADEAILYNLIARVYISMAREAGNNFLVSNNKGVTGRIDETPYRERVILKKAIEYLNKSIMILITIGRLDYLQDSYKYLSEAESMAGQYKDAMESYKRYAVLKDSVYSDENKIKIVNLETEREIDLKNKQIEIDQLETRNKDRQIQIDKLEVARKKNIGLFFISGIILLLVVVTIMYRNLRLSAAKELSENKLNAFQARMNPHFIFNSFNSIQSLMLNNEIIPSIKYLSEFSKLMRQILDNSAKNKVRLSEEIQMLKSYILLEQLRYNNFKWDINIAENVFEEAVFVPGMIIQPFVENSIVHGFQPDHKDWLLTISIERQDKQIICIVDDNGIGREKSYAFNRERDKERQSYGTNIAISRLALLNNNKRGLVNKVIYTDKTENGIATGTKVTIQIPIL